VRLIRHIITKIKRNLGARSTNFGPDKMASKNAHLLCSWRFWVHLYADQWKQ